MVADVRNTEGHATEKISSKHTAGWEGSRPAFIPKAALLLVLIGGAPGYNLRDWLILKLEWTKGRAVVKIATLG